MQSEVNVKFCDIAQILDAPLFFTEPNDDPKQLYVLLKDVSADYLYIVANIHLGRIEALYKSIGEFIADYEGAVFLDIKVETELAGFLRDISPNVSL